MDGESQHREERTKNQEWIWLVYLAFFVLAVMSPSLITHDYFGIPQAQTEEILIFMFGLAGLAVFSLYERHVEKRVKERDEAVNQAERAMKELLESYRYIGSVNRQIEVLKQVVNTTSLSLVNPQSLGRDIMQSLIANAASSINSDRALLRVICLEKLRTESEFHHFPKERKGIRIGNKELKKFHDFGTAHAFLRTDDGENALVVPSDRKGSKDKTFLVVLADPEKLSDVEISLLKVFVNQAELVYYSLLHQKDPNAPLEQVEQVAGMALGEIS